MRYFALLVFAAAGPAFGQVEAFGYKWSVPAAAEWRVENDSAGPLLRMLAARPSEAPRRPVQFALADTPPLGQVTVEAEVKRIQTSLILVYAWRDPSHFNYAHLSSDAASAQPVHNGIFHVYGGDRVRISTERGPAALPSADEWYRVKLTYDGASGTVDVAVNGAALPALHAVDLSLGPGRVGLGSFFETALFRNVKISAR